MSTNLLRNNYGSGPLLSKGGSRSVDNLAKAQEGRPVVQDYCPFPESIEWELGQRYLRERGSKAFLHDAAPVPFVINNDGSLSLSAAQLLFTSLMEAEKDSGLEDDIFVLELGIGVGLFARLFLDAFRVLCLEHGKDYYDRLCYVAGDYADRMLLDACRHGTFGSHPGRYVLRVVDALHPEDLGHTFAFGQQVLGPFRAVFLNYLLDCLPATVLRASGEQICQLCVRTCLARGVSPAEHPSLDVEELRRQARSADPEERRHLLEAFPLLMAEYDYRPVDWASMLYADFAARLARATGTGQVVHSYGAIQCLERLLGMVHKQGFILINDYGQTQAADTDAFEHQRFSGSTFVGVNFPLLRAFFGTDGQHQWAEPAEECESIHARLLGHRPSLKVVERFRQLFGKVARDEVQQPVQLARALAGSGRTEAALAAYRQALEQQPLGWVLMSEVARFLTFTLQSPQAGLALARDALALNPACSPELWNTFGDALFVLGRIDEARFAFRRALKINPQDVRAHYNLTFVHVQEKDYAQALHTIAQGLALDAAGEYREGFLQKQNEVLGRLTARYQQEARLLANRTNTCPVAPKPDSGGPGPRPATSIPVGSGGTAGRAPPGNLPRGIG
jgi:tetratricopeptide (TPR) repeat protein